MCNIWCRFPASVQQRPVAYFDLSLLAGLGADRLDDVTAVTPDFLVVDPQAALIPAAHVDVGEAVLPDRLEVHDFISGGLKKAQFRQSVHPSPSYFFFFNKLSAFSDLPGESPFWSKWMVSPDTPVKLVLIRNSSSLRPSMGRMFSHKPCF